MKLLCSDPVTLLPPAVFPHQWLELEELPHVVLALLRDVLAPTVDRIRLSPARPQFQRDDLGKEELACLPKPKGPFIYRNTNNLALPVSPPPRLLITPISSLPILSPLHLISFNTMLRLFP